MGRRVWDKQAPHKLTNWDMKTKSIFVLLLAMLFLFGANPSRGNATECLCPAEITDNQVKSAIANTFKDICSDCGHTSNCCFTHKEIPFVGTTTLSQLPLQWEAPIVTVVSFKRDSASSRALAASGVNKAPPWRQKQTLISLHQRLLI